MIMGRIVLIFFINIFTGTPEIIIITIVKTAGIISENTFLVKNKNIMFKINKSIFDLGSIRCIGDELSKN